jgi:penicillin-binding protein 1B
VNPKRTSLALLVASLCAALVFVLTALTPLELPELSVPSRVYARPHRISLGQDVKTSGLVSRLRRLGYREIERGEPRPGEMRLLRDRIVLNRRPFRTPLAAGSEGRVEVHVGRDGRIASIRGAGSRRLPSVLLEPEPVGAFHGLEREDRRLVLLEDFPVYLIDAVLVIEDRRFFDHAGVDLRRTLGALIADLRAMRIVQGGSTLTQQLVKNVFLTDERTIARKIREAWLALRVERGQSKEEILEAYLNTIYMGQQGPVSVRGMDAAGRHYFGKHASELSLAEAALLAGLIRGPGLYSPFTAPESARERRDQVLAILLETERISEPQYQRAVAQPLGNLSQAPESATAPYFIALIRRELERDLPDLDLDEARLDVYTGLDAQLQIAADHAVRDGLTRLEADFPHLVEDEDDGGGPLQAALIALDPRSGDVLAHVGGREWRRSQFDRASQAERQPGSVFKPVVALAALARGPDGSPRFTLASRLEDAPFELETTEGVWAPENYDGEFRGWTNLRRALEHSINVPIARLGLEIGPQEIVATARRLGIKAHLAPVPSLALGAFEISPIEVARTYSVLASGGYLVKTRPYARVVDIDGRDLLARHVESERVFEAAEVRLVTSALEGAVKRGTGRGLRMFGFNGPVAGKTGTTNDFRDAWFVGYTPEIVVVVWVGFDDGKSIKLTGAGAALPIFARFITRALGTEGGADFPIPEGVEFVDVHEGTGLRAGFGCWGEREMFLTGSAPRERCGPGWFRPPDDPEPAEDSSTRRRSSVAPWIRILDTVAETVDEITREIERGRDERNGGR